MGVTQLLTQFQFVLGWESERRFTGHKICPAHVNSKYTDSSIAFSQTAIASGVLETSQVQILGPLPQKEHFISRDETELYGNHFNLGMEPNSHSSPNFYTVQITVLGDYADSVQLKPTNQRLNNEHL